MSSISCRSSNRTIYPLVSFAAIRPWSFRETCIPTPLPSQSVNALPVGEVFDADRLWCVHAQIALDWSRMTDHQHQFWGKGRWQSQHPSDARLAERGNRAGAKAEGMSHVHHVLRRGTYVDRVGFVPLLQPLASRDLVVGENEDQRGRLGEQPRRERADKRDLGG